VTFEDQRKTGEFPAGKTLLSAAIEMGVVISHVCGGDGACGTCRVEVVQGAEHLTPPTPDETYKEIEPPHRLSCQSKLVGDVVVKVAKIE
jgi:ferredoxin